MFGRSVGRSQKKLAGDIDRTTAAMAVRWPKAFQLAAHAGLEAVYGVEEAAFEVKLARPT